MSRPGNNRPNQPEPFSHLIAEVAAADDTRNALQLLFKGSPVDLDLAPEHLPTILREFPDLPQKELYLQTAANEGAANLTMITFFAAERRAGQSFVIIFTGDQYQASVLAEIQRSPHVCAFQKAPASHGAYAYFIYLKPNRPKP